MSLRARVAFVKRVAAGSRVSYGARHRFDHDTTVATVPIGYADGVPRRLGTLDDTGGADVLIGGRRCPIVGVVTMDQLMVDVGGVDGSGTVAVGDEVVLIGRQGDHVVRAERLGRTAGNDRLRDRVRDRSPRAAGRAFGDLWFLVASCPVMLLRVDDLAGTDAVAAATGGSGAGR